MTLIWKRFLKIIIFFKENSQNEEKSIWKNFVWVSVSKLFKLKPQNKLKQRKKHKKSL